MSKHTPIVTILSLALLLPAAAPAAEPAPEKAQASDCKPGRTDLDARLAAISETVRSVEASVAKLKGFAPACTSYANDSEFKKMVFERIPGDARAFEKRVRSQVEKLELVCAGRNIGGDAAACEGAKREMLAMLAGKRKPIASARQGVSQVLADIDKSRAETLYKKQIRLYGKTSYEALIIAFTPDSNFKSCPREARSTVERLFRLKDPTYQAAINRLRKQVGDLEAYLVERERLVDQNVAEVDKMSCETLVKPEQVGSAGRGEASRPPAAEATKPQAMSVTASSQLKAIPSDAARDPVEPNQWEAYELRPVSTKNVAPEANPEHPVLKAIESTWRSGASSEAPVVALPEPVPAVDSAPPQAAAAPAATYDDWSSEQEDILPADGSVIHIGGASEREGMASQGGESRMVP